VKILFIYKWFLAVISLYRASSAEIVFSQELIYQHGWPPPPPAHVHGRKGGSFSDEICFSLNLKISIEIIRVKN
jgi:hypothetical protein